jgi:hypothetical protein
MTAGVGGRGRSGARVRATLLVALLAGAPLLGLAWPHVGPALSSLLPHHSAPEGSDAGVDAGTAGPLPFTSLQALASGSGFAQAMPHDAGELMRLAGAQDDLPLPEPAADAPLRQALADHLRSAGEPVPADLEARVLALELTPDAERAVAVLLQAYDEARTLQGDALAGLTDGEVQLLALQADAVQAWGAAHPGATPDDLVAALAGLVAHVDTGKSLQAASLLARAVEAARPALALPPADGVADRLADPWLVLRQAVEAAYGAHAVALPHLPAMPLADALRVLAVEAGQPDPGALALPALPPALADALSRLAVAQAFALASGDPLLGGLALVEAAHAAAPVLESYAAWRSLAASAGSLPAGDPLLADIAAAASSLGLLLATPASSSSPVPGGPDVPDGSDLPPAPDAPPAPNPELPVPGSLEELRADSDDDGVPDSVEILLGTDSNDPASRPVGDLPAGLPPLPSNGTLLLVGRPGADPSEPALLSLGDVTAEVVERPALLRVDLGGDDTYHVAVGTATAFLLELGGNDRYDTPLMDGTQGSVDGLGAGILLDLAGKDTYLAGRRAQGSACCGRGGLDIGPPIVVAPADPSGTAAGLGDHAAPFTAAPVPAAWESFDRAVQNAHRQAGGLGLLADLGADGDTYRSGRQSQGYGNALAVTAAYDTLSPGQPSRGFAGILYDAGGNDSYRFSTQGVADASGLATPTFPDNEGGRAVGLFLDAAGDDRYDNLQEPETSRMPLKGTDHGRRLFASQGNATVGATPPGPAPSPVGAFLDLGGTDLYFIPAQDGSLINASDDKNGAAPAPATPSQRGAPASVFLDLDPNHPQGPGDDDGDGAPSVVERIAGTDPNDPADTPGSAFDDQDPDAPKFVRMPHLLGRDLGGTLVLPGLAIAGRLGDEHNDTYDFFLDLGGDDTYRAAGHGGAAIADGRAPQQRPPAVRLAVDAGGDDRYLPAAPDLALSAPGQDTLRYASAPSLGGAHLGVSVMADLGGHNTFRSGLNVSATHEETPGGGQQFGAMSAGWTVSQGAGMLGGVGVLLTFDSTNTFDASVSVRAEDKDPDQMQAVAVGYAASQGAGFLGGVGVLANLNDSADAGDTYRLEAQARASAGANSLVSVARPVGLGQGAGMAGTGILVDAGGNNTFAAPQGVAQGVGWGFGDRTGGTTPIDAQGSRPAENPASTQVETAAGFGLLVAGPGDDRFEAAGPAQGAGGAYQQLDELEQTSRNAGRAPALRGGVGAGMLLDLGGNDVREVDAASPSMVEAFGDPAPLLSQGAAAAGSFGMLADLAGDDAYRSSGGFWSQAAAVGGVALLLDLEGQDEYTAQDAAQGYAQAAVVASAREHVCTFYFSPIFIPCNAREVASAPAVYKSTRGMETLAEVVPEGLTMALLLDTDGVDLYHAGQESQGFATDQADAPFKAAFCRGIKEPNPNIGQPNLAPCPIPAGKKEGTDVTMPEDDADFIPAQPVGPAARGPLVGLLLDSDGSDTYRYDDDLDGDAVRKEPADPLDPATGPNDWTWRQEAIAPRTVDDVNLPGNPFTGPLDQLTDPTTVPVGGGVSCQAFPTSGPDPRVTNTLKAVNAQFQPVCGAVLPSGGGGGSGGTQVPGLPPQDVLDLLWESALKSYPELPAGAGSQEVPAPPHLGGGIDASTLGRALRSFSDAGAPVATVTLDVVHLDGTTLDQGSATRTVLLRGRVDAPPGVGVARVDVVSDRGAIARTSANDDGTYGMPWVTNATDDAGEPLFPDGPYGLHAVAVLRAAPGAAGRSVESDRVPVQVDNPPALTLVGDRDAFSGRASPPPEPLTLHVVVGPDRDRPGQAPGTRPGGTLSIVAHPLDHADPDVQVHPATVHDAGPLDVVWTGRCGNAPCRDGNYSVDATLTDFGGQPAVAHWRVRLDSTPPVSQVSLLPYVRQSRDSLGGIDVSWDVRDPGAGLGNVTVDLVRLGAGGVHTLAKRDVASDQRTATVGPLSSGETVRLVTMARDGLGNLEGGCEANDGPDPVTACIDAFVSAHPERVRQAVADFDPPHVLDVALSRTHVRPGDPLAVRANITEAGTGLTGVRVEFTEDPAVHALQASPLPGAPNLWEYDGWGDVDGAFDANERTVTATVTATDLAGNDDSLAATLVLDAVKPRLALAEPEYFAPGGFDESSRLLVGRPGAFALLHLDVTDASLKPGLPGVLVQTDLSALNASLAPRNMTFDASRLQWGAQVHIPDDVPNGAYDVNITARDAAGNVNATVATLLVSDQPIPLGPLTAVDVGHDHVTLAWQSVEPATTQVRYGRSALNLPQATHADGARLRLHTVTVPGLAPNTAYFFEGVSRGGNGIENHTGLLAVRTRSAIDLHLDGIAEGSVQGGFAAVHVGVRLLTGEEAPVDVSLSMRSDNESVGSIPLRALGAAVGDRDATLDLRTVPDGAWHLVVEATRPGDRAILVSPLFRIDHSEPFIVPLMPHPGAVVNLARPGILLAVGDPGGDLAYDWASTATLRVGKDLVAVKTAPGAGVEAPEGTTLLLLEPQADLPEGEVRVEAAIRDAGGNAARALWPFTVDTTPPTLVSAKAIGPAGQAAAPPGSHVRVEVAATDASGLAGGWVDLQPFRLPPAYLARSGPVWAADVAVPTGTADGVRALNVTLSDRAGNLRSIGTVRLAVDGTPPSLLAAEPRAGRVSLDLAAHASEPVMATAVLPDGRRIEAGSLQAPSLDPQVHVPSLLPGTDYTLDLVLTDAAGLNGTSHLSLSTLADTEAPGLPLSFAASSDEEGQVDLSWLPAADDSGILRYEAATGDASDAADAGNWTAVADGGNLTARIAAQPGHALHVRLRAVDLAGRAGDAVEADVDVLALPHLKDARALSEVAEAGKPVTFEVTYWHAAGKAADVTLLLGNQSIPMRVASGDCATGCRMVAEATLQATDLFDGPPTFTVVADDGAHEARTEPQRAPLAVASDAKAPGVGLPIALLLVGLAAFRRRQP